MIQSAPSITRRLLCLVYEFLVIFSILLVGFVFPQTVLTGFGFNSPPKLLWVHVFLLLMLYFVWSWCHGGQTLPMKTWKLQVQDKTGRSIRIGQAIFRYCLVWMGMSLFGIGFFWALIDKDKLFAHDRIAGTKVVQTH